MSADGRRGALQIDATSISGSQTPAGAARAEGGAGVGLAGLVLLSGGVRRTELSGGMGRSVLDLPLVGGHTLLELWSRHAETLAPSGHPLPVRVLVSQSLPLPYDPPAHARLRIEAEHDKAELRGTGGVLRDISDEYPDDNALLLVASGNQVLLRPLAELVALMAGTGGDVTLLAEADGTSVGLHLVRAGALRSIRAKGYVDLKEQALPQLAKERDVRVVHCPWRAALPVRTLDQYMVALRALAGGGGAVSGPAAEGEAHTDAYAEEWSPTFQIVDAGASVAPGAMVHDAVVMRGASVGAGAVVVRSLVCPGARVAAGAVVTDSVVPAPEAARASRGRAGMVLQ